MQTSKHYRNIGFGELLNIGNYSGLETNDEPRYPGEGIDQEAGDHDDSEDAF